MFGRGLDLSAKKVHNFARRVCRVCRVCRVVRLCVCDFTSWGFTLFLFAL
jgi:hypothetical protein